VISKTVGRLSIVDGFLSQQVRTALLSNLLSRESEFTTAKVTSVPRMRPIHDCEIRSSRVISAPGPALRSVFVPHLKGFLRRPAQARVQAIEVQLTASGDGDFYGRHSDRGPRAHARRTLTFVYFLHTLPRKFTGGVLRVEAPRGALSPGPESRVAGRRHPEEIRIDPEDNRLVLFPSEWLHEILPVQVPSRDFRDSRFTVNGWIHLARSEADCEPALISRSTAQPGLAES